MAYPGLSNSTGAAAPSTKPANAIQEISARLSDIHASFDGNADRLQRIATRAFGESPADNAKDMPRAVPNGEIGAVMQRLQDLTDLAAMQSAIITRLDGIV